MLLSNYWTIQCWARPQHAGTLASQEHHWTVIMVAPHNMKTVQHKKRCGAVICQEKKCLTTKWNVEQWLANNSPKWGVTQKEKDNHPRRKMQATSCSESGGIKNWAPSRPDNNKSWWPCRCSTVYCPVSNFEHCDNIGFQLWKNSAGPPWATLKNWL